MLYEPREKKKRRHPVRHALIKALVALILLVALLVVAAAGLLYVAPVSVFMLDPAEDLSIASDLPVTRMNILLLGVDFLNYGQQRSDSMMVLSVGSDGVALTSLMRDMVVEIPGYGQQKLNAAFAHGGSALAMQTVNQALSLNVARYVQVDYLGFVHLVDALGGVNVTITEAERDRINEILNDAKQVLQEHGYLVTELSGFGEDTELNGLQSLAYARIRKLDSDYNRTGRQRQLIEAMWKKLRAQGVNLRVINGLKQVLQEDVQTNLSWAEIVSLGLKALGASHIDMHRLPAEGYYEDDGSELTFDAAANATLFRQWVYGN
ncbi:MAG: LCP family protein [Clostridia bacterium]|nr:LCP family protein [Clostridia bacterium]